MAEAQQMSPDVAMLMDDYYDVFTTEKGRRVLADMDQSFGPERDPFVAGDPYTTSYHCGEMNVVQRIHLMVKLARMPRVIVDPEQEAA